MEVEKSQFSVFQKKKSIFTVKHHSYSNSIKYSGQLSSKQKNGLKSKYTQKKTIKSSSTFESNNATLDPRMSEIIIEEEDEDEDSDSDSSQLSYTYLEYNKDSDISEDEDVQQQRLEILEAEKSVQVIKKLFKQFDDDCSGFLDEQETRKLLDVMFHDIEDKTQKQKSIGKFFVAFGRGRKLSREKLIEYLLPMFGSSEIIIGLLMKKMKKAKKIKKFIQL